MFKQEELLRAAIKKSMIREMIPTHLFSWKHHINTWRVTWHHHTNMLAALTETCSLHANNQSASCDRVTCSGDRPMSAQQTRHVGCVPGSRDHLWESFCRGVRYYSVPHKAILTCRTLTLLRAHCPAEIGPSSSSSAPWLVRSYHVTSDLLRNWSVHITWS